MLASGEAPYPSCPSSVRRMTRWLILPPHSQHRGTWRAGRYPALVLQVQLLARCYGELRSRVSAILVWILDGSRSSKSQCPDFRADWGGNLNAERGWDHAGWESNSHRMGRKGRTGATQSTSASAHQLIIRLCQLTRSVRMPLTAQISNASPRDPLPLPLNEPSLVTGLGRVGERLGRAGIWADGR